MARRRAGVTACTAREFASIRERFDEPDQNQESVPDRVARIAGARKNALRHGAEVFVVVAEKALVRDHPSAKTGVMIGGKRRGELVFGVPTAAKLASPLQEVRDDTWVQLWESEERLASTARKQEKDGTKTGGAYMLVDATSLGHGILLKRSTGEEDGVAIRN